MPPKQWFHASDQRNLLDLTLGEEVLCAADVVAAAAAVVEDEATGVRLEVENFAVNRFHGSTDVTGDVPSGTGDE